MNFPMIIIIKKLPLLSTNLKKNDVSKYVHQLHYTNNPMASRPQWTRHLLLVKVLHVVIRVLFTKEFIQNVLKSKTSKNKSMFHESEKNEGFYFFKESK